MNRILTAILMIFILSINSGHSQTFEWAKSIEGIVNVGSAFGKAVDIDNNGNVYTTGNFSGLINLNTVSLTSTGLTDVYISRYDKDGVIDWAVKAGGSDMESVYDISCDDNGNSYIIGYYAGTATFGPYTLNGGSGATFVAKFDNSGTCQWAKSIDSYSDTRLNIAADEDPALGICYATGSFNNQISIGSVNLTSNGEYDIYVAKFSANGNVEWAVNGGGFLLDETGGIEVDAAHNVHLSGTITGPGNFLGTDLATKTIITPTTEFRYPFYINYNSDGIIISGSSQNSTGMSYGIGADDNSNSYIINDYSITKVTIGGNTEWEKSWSGPIMPRDVKTDKNGNSYVFGIYQATVSFPPYSISSTGSFDVFVVKYDNSGTVKWVASAGGSNFEEGAGGSADLAGNAYITGDYSSTTANFGSISLNSSHLFGSGNSYISKLNGQSNIITGLVYIDYSNIGVRDANEPVFPGILVSSASGTPIAASNSLGNYYSFCGGLSNTVSILNPPLYYIPNPASYTVNFPGLGNTSYLNDFGLYPEPNKNDLRISLSDMSRARANRQTILNISYKNIGTTTISSGTIELTFDNYLSYASYTSNPNLSTYNLSGNTITWDYTNLAPNETGNITIVLNVSSTAPVGTILTSTASIPLTGDLVPADNEDILEQEVFASCDPNDKSVMPAGDLTPQNILDEVPLTYTIRFQNTGNDTAFLIVITDTLSAKLDIASIETISASHNYTLRLENGNILVWTFDNILLPDSTTNEIESHGFVKYKIKPKNNLIVGDEIVNAANIYFDSNLPVITNSTITTVSDISSVNLIQNGSFTSYTIGTNNIISPSGTSQVDHWYSSFQYGRPRIITGIGCGDDGYVQLKGDQIQGYVVSQTGLNIQAGHTYRISVCVDVFRDFGTYHQTNRLGVTFTNGYPNSYPPAAGEYPDNYNGLIIGDNAPTTPAPVGNPPTMVGGWTTYSYLWIAPDNYNTVSFNAVNEINEGPVSMSGVKIDNVSIEEVAPQINVIFGNIFLDYNSNGIKDGNERPYQNAVVSVSPYGYTSSANSGSYILYTGSGNYDISVPNLPLYYAAHPSNHSASFSGLGEIDADNKFALQPIPGIKDLRIMIVNVSPVRPGRGGAFDIIYENVGTEVITDHVTLEYDSRLTYSTSSPNHNSHSGNILTWNFTGLEPGTSRTIHVYFDDPNVTLITGDYLGLTARVYPINVDVVPHNNAYEGNTFVVNSYDPNDITVNPSGIMTPSQVASEDSLTYTIRFQNTGTASAIDIRVVDTLSSLMNIPSLQLVGASHNYTFSLSQTGVAEWKFKNIYLPDSTSNEPGSHGYIVFRVKPKNNLVVGDSIRSTAHIYFDFNDPVVTNTAVTAIAVPANSLDLKFKLQAMYPIIDTIQINLRNAASPYQVIDSVITVTNVEGNHFISHAGFMNVQTGSSYYIEIKHRNSIATWSANPVLFSGETTIYDFTSSLSQAYGNNMTIVDGVPSIYSGDVNQDEITNVNDMLEIYNALTNFASGYLITDLDGDGIVDLNDLNIVYNNNVKFVQVMKP